MLFSVVYIPSTKQIDAEARCTHPVDGFGVSAICEGALELGEGVAGDDGAGVTSVKTVPSLGAKVTLYSVFTGEKATAEGKTEKREGGRETKEMGERNRKRE